MYQAARNEWNETGQVHDGAPKPDRHTTLPQLSQSV